MTTEQHECSELWTDKRKKAYREFCEALAKARQLHLQRINTDAFRAFMANPSSSNRSVLIAAMDLYQAQDAKPNK